MPERHNKVIHYSLSMPKYIMMIVSACLFLVAFALQAYAETPQSNTNPVSIHQHNPETADGVHRLIDKHVRAIRSRNANQAYHLISLNGQEKYGTAKHYWRDVRENMRLLFNHNSYEFLGRNTVNGMVIQKVNMIDKNGKENLVIFRVIRDKADNWRIENVIITGTNESIA